MPDTVKIPDRSGELQTVLHSDWLTANRASGMVGLGVAVTLDGVRFRLAPSGNISLQMATVSGTAGIDGQREALNNAGFSTALHTVVATTTWTYLDPALNFTFAGNVQRYTYINQTTNRAYRVTMVVDSGYNQNAISIERLT
jgi:hypothetical protein